MSAQRVLFLTSGPNAPATRYRILPYLPRLRKLGLECDVRHSFPEKYQRLRLIGWRASHLLRGLMRRWDLWQARGAKYDAIVLEREIFDDPTWNMEAAFRLVTRRFLLDVDDGIFLRYPEKFEKIAGMADHILAGNRLLAEECRKFCPHVSVIPTAIDLDDYPCVFPRPVHRIPVIGWIGTAANLPYLKVAFPALKQLAEHRPFVLRIITSDEAEVHKLPFGTIPVEFRRWSAQSATQEIQQFDIGIMPLPDAPWERHKCGFKLLQYMAASLPAVASPVGANREIVSSKVDGILAATDQEWHDSLNQLLGDADWRTTLGRSARCKIEKHYSIDGYLPEVASIIMQNVLV